MSNIRRRNSSIKDDSQQIDDKNINQIEFEPKYSNEPDDKCCGMCFWCTQEGCLGLFLFICGILLFPISIFHYCCYRKSKSFEGKFFAYLSCWNCSLQLLIVVVPVFGGLLIFIIIGSITTIQESLDFVINTLDNYYLKKPFFN